MVLSPHSVMTLTTAVALGVSVLCGRRAPDHLAESPAPASAVRLTALTSNTARTRTTLDTFTMTSRS